MELSLISKYRTQLMGVSILWVMFFHAHSRIREVHFLTFLQDIGYGGVDFFYFLSGLGVYYAYKGNAKDFYIRRIKRIFPYYLPLVLAYSLYMYYINYISGGVVVTNILLLSFWFNLPGTFDWYIPSLLLLYLLTPLFLNYFRKDKVIPTVFVLVFTLITYFLFVDTVLNHLLIVFLRFPVFLGGIWVGYLIKENKVTQISRFWTVFFALSFIVGIGLLFYFFEYHIEFRTRFSQTMLPFWLMTFPFCMFISYGLSKLENYKYPILTFFGTYSLLLYITHVKIIEITLFYVNKFVDVIALVLTLLFVVIWQKFVDWIMKRYFN